MSSITTTQCDGCGYTDAHESTRWGGLYYHGAPGMRSSNKDLCRPCVQKLLAHLDGLVEPSHDTMVACKPGHGFTLGERVNLFENDPECEPVGWTLARDTPDGTHLVVAVLGNCVTVRPCNQHPKNAHNQFEVPMLELKVKELQAEVANLNKVVDARERQLGPLVEKRDREAELQAYVEQAVCLARYYMERAKLHVKHADVLKLELLLARSK